MFYTFHPLRERISKTLPSDCVYFVYIVCSLNAHQLDSVDVYNCQPNRVSHNMLLGICRLVFKCPPVVRLGKYIFLLTSINIMFESIYLKLTMIYFLISI